MMFNVEFNENSCHICLSNDGNKEHINESDLKLKYHELTSVEVLLYKGMPSYICEFCKSKLIIAVHFKKQCMMSHKLLLKYYEEIIQEGEKEEAESGETIEIIETLEIENGEIVEIENAMAKFENGADEIENEATGIISDRLLPQAEKSIEVEKSQRKVIKKRKQITRKRRAKRPKEEIIEIIEIEETENGAEEEQQLSQEHNVAEDKAAPTLMEFGNYHIQIGSDDEGDNEGKINDDKKENCIGVIELSSQVRMKNVEPTTDGKKYKVYDGKRVMYMSQCPICNKMQYNLKQHMSVHTGEKKHKCPYCYKTFAQKGNLNHHVNIHTGHKPYACKVCDKSFPEPNSLRSHMIFHTRERNYHCEVCGKNFGYSHTLTAHKRIHTNDRPYKCTICNKSFLARHTLTKHIRSHTGEKPYKCDICNKAFASSGNLTTHKIVHTKVRRFNCTICKMKFSYKNVLKTHMRKVHKIEDEANDSKSEVNSDSNSTKNESK